MPNRMDWPLSYLQFNWVRKNSGCFHTWPFTYKWWQRPNGIHRNKSHSCLQWGKDCFRNPHYWDKRRRSWGFKKDQDFRKQELSFGASKHLQRQRIENWIRRLLWNPWRKWPSSLLSASEWLLQFKRGSLRWVHRHASIGQVPLFKTLWQDHQRMVGIQKQITLLRHWG